jgi:mannose-6-phosphate isomerase-like protein (cupin superfamily)
MEGVQTMKISKHTAEHYIWGGKCDGWHLVKNEALSVIHERMPAGTSEVRHYHETSRQFFFMLSGSATLEMNGENITLHPNEGAEVPPLVPHQMFNRSNGDIEFLVISQPNSKGDRILDDKKAKNAPCS